MLKFSRIAPLVLGFLVAVAVVFCVTAVTREVSEFRGQLTELTTVNQ